MVHENDETMSTTSATENETKQANVEEKTNSSPFKPNIASNDVSGTENMSDESSHIANKKMIKNVDVTNMNKNKKTKKRIIPHHDSSDDSSEDESENEQEETNKNKNKNTAGSMSDGKSAIQKRKTMHMSEFGEEEENSDSEDDNSDSVEKEEEQELKEKQKQTEPKNGDNEIRTNDDDVDDSNSMKSTKESVDDDDDDYSSSDDVFKLIKKKKKENDEVAAAEGDISSDDDSGGDGDGNSKKQKKVVDEKEQQHVDGDEEYSSSENDDDEDDNHKSKKTKKKIKANKKIPTTSAGKQEDAPLPDPSVLSLTHPAHIPPRAVRDMPHWAFLVVTDVNNPDTWELPVRGPDGTINLPLLRDARKQITTGKRFSAPVSFILSDCIISRFQELCDIAWPGLPHVVVAKTILVQNNKTEPEGRIWLSATNSVRSEARRVIESMGLSETKKGTPRASDTSSADEDSDSEAEYNDEEEVNFAPKTHTNNTRPKRKIRAKKAKDKSNDTEESSIPQPDESRSLSLVERMRARRQAVANAEKNRASIVAKQEQEVSTNDNDTSNTSSHNVIPKDSSEAKSQAEESESESDDDFLVFEESSDDEPEEIKPTTAPISTQFKQTGSNLAATAERAKTRTQMLAALQAKARIDAANDVARAHGFDTVWDMQRAEDDERQAEIESAADVRRLQQQFKDRENRAGMARGNGGGGDSEEEEEFDFGASADSASSKIDSTQLKDQSNAGDATVVGDAAVAVDAGDVDMACDSALIDDVADNAVGVVGATSDDVDADADVTVNLHTTKPTDDTDGCLDEVTKIQVDVDDSKAAASAKSNNAVEKENEQLSKTKPANMSTDKQSVQLSLSTSAELPSPRVIKTFTRKAKNKTNISANPFTSALNKIGAGARSEEKSKVTQNDEDDSAQTAIESCAVVSTGAQPLLSTETSPSPSATPPLQLAPDILPLPNSINVRSLSTDTQPLNDTTDDAQSLPADTQPLTTQPLLADTKPLALMTSTQPQAPSSPSPSVSGTKNDNDTDVKQVVVLSKPVLNSVVYEGKGVNTKKQDVSDAKREEEEEEKEEEEEENKVSEQPNKIDKSGDTRDGSDSEEEAESTDDGESDDDEEEDEDEDDNENKKEKHRNGQRNTGYLAALRQEVETANLMRRGNKFMENEAEEEEEDAAVGNYGDNNPVNQSLKRQRQEVQQERKFAENITAEDLEGIVDTYSDDEGDNEIAEDEHRKFESEKDDKLLKRLTTDVEKHRFGRRGVKGRGLTRVSRALDDDDEDEDESEEEDSDEEGAMAREERYRSLADARRQEILEGKGKGHTSIAEVDEEHEQELNFQRIARLQSIKLKQSQIAGDPRRDLVFKQLLARQAKKKKEEKKNNNNINNNNKRVKYCGVAANKKGASSATGSSLDGRKTQPVSIPDSDESDEDIIDGDSDDDVQIGDDHDGRKILRMLSRSNSSMAAGGGSNSGVVNESSRASIFSLEDESTSRISRASSFMYTGNSQGGSNFGTSFRRTTSSFMSRSKSVGGHGGSAGVLSNGSNSRGAFGEESAQLKSVSSTFVYTAGKMSKNPLDECDDEVAQTGTLGGDVIGTSVSASRKRVTPAPSYVRLGRSSSSNSGAGSMSVKRQKSLGGGGALSTLLAKSTSMSKLTSKRRGPNFR